MMQRGNDDDIDKRGFFRWILRLVVVKFMAGHKEEMSVREKLIKKESKSDITIYFKQREDSEDNANRTNTSCSEKGRVIMLVNGSNGNTKKMMIHEKEKSIVGEASFRQPVIANLEDGKSHPMPLLNDINTKSDAFIRSRLEKMRKSL